MRSAVVLYKTNEAGILSQLDDGTFQFQYSENYLLNSDFPAISLTLPKKKLAYKSEFLFPFFYNMLPEGSNKQKVCFLLRIDETDYFSLLLNTAKFDTIGAVRIFKMEAI